MAFLLRAIGRKNENLQSHDFTSAAVVMVVSYQVLVTFVGRLYNTIPHRLPTSITK